MSETAPVTSAVKPSTKPIIIGFAIVELFIIAIGIGPYMIDRHHNLGRRYVSQGLYEKAIPHYLKLVKRFPQATTINYELGQAYLRSGQYPQAIKHLEIATKSGVPDVHRLLGQAYLGAKNSEEALRQFQQTLKVDGNDPVASFHVGQEFFRRKEYTVAAAYLERATADSTHGEQARAMLAEISREVFGE